MTEQWEDGRDMALREQEDRKAALRQVIDQVSESADRWARLADQRAHQMKDLFREVEELRAQNAELLEALVAARKAWVYEASQGDGIMIEHDQVIDAVDAAIAAAKGGAE